MRLNPTLVLCTCVLSAFFGALALAVMLPHRGYLVLGALSSVESLAIFVLYIVVHDAAHRSASKRRGLNEAMLFACGVVFLFDPIIYRKLHLTHHAHANEDADPDHFTASRFLAVRWAKSFLIGIAYYVYALRRFRMSPALLLHLSFTPLVVGVLYTGFRAAGAADVFVAGWAIPDVVAMGFLGFVLTAWPHHPAKETSRIGNARNLDVPKVLQWLLGYQHLHLVHHFAPSVAWYRLPAYWRQHKDALVAKGAPPIP